MALVPAGVATGSLGLSTTAGGSLLAGWVQGPPPQVFAGGPNVSRSARTRAGGRQQAMLATGSLAAGFRRPLVLTAGPSGSLLSFHITLSASGVGYAVWEQPPGTKLRLSVVCGGRLVVSDRLLVRDAVPLALFPLAGGRAALVFDQYGRGTPFLRYAILSSSGRLGAVARIAHPGTRDTEATELSVNPAGGLIASWVHNDVASRPGSSPASPGFKAANLVVAVCKPALHCSAPRAVPLGDIKPACINPAVAISPNGTTTVIAASHGWSATGCDQPLGVRASVTHGRTSSVSPMRLIEPEGDFPVAEPAGNAGTVMVENAGGAPSDSLGWSWLPTTGTNASKRALLDARGLWDSAAQTNLAPAVNGWYVIAWTHANRKNNPQLSVRAAVAHNDRVEPASVAIGSRPYPNQYVAATDGHGNAMILFNGSTDIGNGAPWPYTSGLYVTTRSP